MDNIIFLQASGCAFHQQTYVKWLACYTKPFVVILFALRKGSNLLLLLFLARRRPYTTRFARILTT